MVRLDLFEQTMITELRERVDPTECGPGNHTLQSVRAFSIFFHLSGLSDDPSHVNRTFLGFSEELGNKMNRGLKE